MHTFDCKTIRQLSGVLGLMAFIAIPSAFAKAPKCSGVLLRGLISEVAIADTIKDIAKMRLELDVALVQGTYGHYLLATQMQAVFKAKYSDLVNQLAGQKTEKEIKDLIALDINELQGIKVKEAEVELVVRETQKDALVFYPDNFEKGNTVELPLKTQAWTFEVIPKSTKIVMDESVTRDLLIFDLANSKTEILEKSVVLTTFSTNKNNLYSYTEDGRIFSYDFRKEQKSSVKLSKHIEHQLIGTLSVDPSGKQVALGINDPLIYLVDLGSGKVSQRKIRFKNTPDTTISSADFLDSNTLLIMSSDREAVLYDIATKKTRELRFENNYFKFYSVKVIPESREVILVGDGVVAKVSIEDLLEGNLMDMKLSTFYVGLVRFAEMTYKNSGFFAGSGKQFGLYRLGDSEKLEPKARFYRNSEGMEVMKAITYDPFSSRAYFLYHNGGNYYIDVYSGN